MKGRNFYYLLFLITLVLVTLIVPNTSFANATPSFPSCFAKQGEANIQYSSGIHGIAGDNNTYSGSDSVYEINSTQVLQCFCGNTIGIQTNWWSVSNSTLSQLQSYENQGWIYVPTGETWGLSNNPYLAKNINYSCDNSNINNNSNGGKNSQTNNGVNNNVSAPVCNDQAPSGSPTITNVSNNINSVTLTWTPASGPVSYYLVAYGTQPGIYSFGNPNAGNANSTSYTINGLSGKTTYYFAIRAGNGCKPGQFSNEVISTPKGIVENGPASNFLPNVLGTSLAPSPAAGNAATLGASVSDLTCKNCIWWPILLGEGLALLIFYLLFIRWYKNQRGYYTEYLIPIGTYIIFLILNHACAFSSPLWEFWKWQIHFTFWACKYFWLLDLLVFIFAMVFFKKSNNYKNEIKNIKK